MSSFDASRTLGKNPKFSTAVPLGPHGRVDPRLELPEPKLKSTFPTPRCSAEAPRTVRRHRKKMAGRFGRFDPGADPEGMAELLMSSFLRFVAQRALSGSADVQAHVGAVQSALGLRAGGSSAA